MVKSHLPLVTSHGTFNQQELQTILVEVEAVLNSRPRMGPCSLPVIY
jgi:hypothetical protein